MVAGADGMTPGVKVFENERKVELGVANPEIAMNKARVADVNVPTATQGTKDVQSSNSSERLVNIGTIIGSWSTAWRSLKQKILQVMCGNETSQLEKIKKRLSNYALKALCFALLILSAYLVQQYTSALFTIGESLTFLIVLVLFLITDAAIAIPLLSDWGNALVCISWFFLELALCILIVSCNGYYGFAILVVLLLVIAVHVAVLQPKLQHVLSHYDGIQQLGISRRPMAIIHQL